MGWMEVGPPKLGVTGISLESQVTLGHRCSPPPHTGHSLACSTGHTIGDM